MGRPLKHPSPKIIMDLVERIENASETRKKAFKKYMAALRARNKKLTLKTQKKVDATAEEYFGADGNFRAFFSDPENALLLCTEIRRLREE